MSVARKTILFILTVVLGVPTAAFVAARIANKQKNRTFDTHSETITKNPGEKPLFYDSVGSSDPDSMNTHGSQRVTRYTVNVKTVRTQQEAEQVLKELTAAGLVGYYTPVRQKDHVVYHVRVGVFPDEREAAQTLAKLQKSVRISGSVSVLQ